MPFLHRNLGPVPIESLPATQRKEVEEYLRAHPLSPAGRLRPRIGRHGENWIALLGPSLADGKVGFGSSPTNALQAFNRGFGRATEAPPAAGVYPDP
ncbi:MAG: hypothetical protein H0T95_02385 [Chthoniobacterales bacterium]|jgi:hypothetical protein|nr:hypothetical protein [Chthoniobacterales bacterium]MBA3761912.1 hypothetical protein [Chthoniobacterales bacterium]